MFEVNFGLIVLRTLIFPRNALVRNVVQSSSGVFDQPYGKMPRLQIRVQFYYPFIHAKC